MELSDWLAIQVAAIFTLGIVSFLYKDNPFYKICESLFLGLSAGYWFVVLFWENLVPKLYDPLYALLTDPTAPWLNLHYVGAAILGVMMLLRLVPKLSWLSRWPLSFVVGATAGLSFITFMQSNLLIQLQRTMLPIFNFELIEAGTATGLNGFVDMYLGNLIIIIGTASGLCYFYFSKEHTGVFGRAARVGIYFLMITFGASFGYTVMSRMSLLIGRIDFMISEWWPSIMAGWM